MRECFKAIDADGSGLVRRAELRTFLKKYSRTTPDNIISGLIDYVDTDGDAKTLSLQVPCHDSPRRLSAAFAAPHSHC